jgi:hypothetical protein
VTCRRFERKLSDRRFFLLPEKLARRCVTPRSSRARNLERSAGSAPAMTERSMEHKSRYAADDVTLDAARDFLHFYAMARKRLDDARGIPGDPIAEVAEGISRHLADARPLVRLLENTIRDRAMKPATAEALVRASSSSRRLVA